MSEIPAIPTPVPFQFHGRTDYTTVYKAIDFPLDHFAIFKQNPVNRDRITEANKMLYSLQKQINDLREALIALAITVDENVEKKVSITVTIGEEEKTIEATLLKDTYTFTVPEVTFGEESSIKIVAKLDEENYLVSSEEISCAEGADATIKATAQKKEGDVEPSITINKSEEPEPEPTEDLKFTIKIGDTETEMTTTDNLTFSANFDTQDAGSVITLTASKAGYKLVGDEPTVNTTTTELSITVEPDETVTEKISIEITVS